MKNTKVSNNKKNINAVDTIIVVFLSIWAFIQIYPIYNAFLISISSPVTFTKTPFLFYPKEIILDAYKYTLGSSAIWNGYKVTLVVVVLGVVFNLFLTTTISYALSKKKFIGKNLILNFIIFTMYFSGGLIPYYILISKLHLINSLAVMIIPTGLNTFYMLIMRNYFMTIPDSIEESAKIDGANELTILWKIMLPLAAPVFATVGLFYAVDRWNEWFLGMMFIKDQNLQPLQLVLRGILANIDSMKIGFNGASSLQSKVLPEGVKMASVFLVMVPIMLVYPFIQKYFMKGMIVGALKG